ncbi:uncharacterized protein L203_100175 [Cryptococcus depauperatus CBS 7841]|uniref:Uncharacterized protein n=1 Tax=Cryptococcus depauperatus CBS 7841 TaxID=1295531 RepID=A0A1E3J009_9TREE|nr:hypothetical protein L203_00164 [Cryptococcus depauperatus CBS 7841]
MTYQWNQGYGGQVLNLRQFKWGEDEEKKHADFIQGYGQGMLDLMGVSQPPFYTGDFQSGLEGVINEPNNLEMGSVHLDGNNQEGILPLLYNPRPSLALDTTEFFASQNQPPSALSNSSLGMNIDPRSNLDNGFIASSAFPSDPSGQPWAFNTHDQNSSLSVLPQNASTTFSPQQSDINKTQPLMSGLYQPVMLPQNNFFHQSQDQLQSQQPQPELGTISPSELGHCQPLKPTKSFGDLMMGSRASSTSSLASQEITDSWNSSGNALENWTTPIARALPSGGSNNDCQPAIDFAHQNSLAKRPSITSPLRQLSSSQSCSESVASIDLLIKHYVHATNRLAMGERKVMVMSPKVGQKSYGTEKRFLCPHPQAMLIGHSWWSVNPDGCPTSPLQPPRVNISLSGESPVKDAPISWTKLDGVNIDDKLNHQGIKAKDKPFFGSVAGKNLHISDNDPKRKDVKALITIKAPLNKFARLNGLGIAKESVQDISDNDVIGVFESKDIKIISKPSKKRSTAKSGELTISHGSTIALFNRIKSQTTSTRYLSVVQDFTRMSGSDGKPITGARPPQLPNQGVFRGFKADGAMWESWIIYLVDPNLPSGFSGKPPPHPDWPSPPANIMSLNTVTPSIRYNSTVVLQSLQTGVTSPVLIIRRIETDADAVGMNGHIAETPLSVPQGELAGDLVSQLQKVAFELYKPDVIEPFVKDNKMGSFWLSCSQDTVKERCVKDEKRWSTINVSTSRPGSRCNSLPNTPQQRFGMLPMTPHTTNVKLPSTPSSPINQSADYFGYHSGRPSGYSNPLMSPVNGENPLPSTDGGPVRRQRTSSVGKGPLARPLHRKRMSADSTGSGPYEYLPSLSTAISGTGFQQEQRMFWTLDVGDTCIWSIISVEQISYSFFMPPIPSYNDVEPVAPFPIVHRLLLPGLSAEQPAKYAHQYTSTVNLPLITFYGKNFTRNAEGGAKHLVYYGETPASHNEVRCQEVMAAAEPSLQAGTILPIFLVRGDGHVIIPTSLTYPT